MVRPTSTAVPTEQARVAVAVAFVVNGFAFASWISRVPAARDALGLSSAGLGLLLLCLAVGSVVALPLTGPVVHRTGPARGVLGGAGLALVGMGVGGWDVAMNIEGAAVEQRLGRVLMPRLHAGFSLGTVAGALLGAGAAALGFPLPAQLVLTAVLALVAVAVAPRSFLPAEPAAKDAHPGGAGVGPGR